MKPPFEDAEERGKASAAELPIPRHLREYFQVLPGNNDEYRVRGQMVCGCKNQSFLLHESDDKGIVKLQCSACSQMILLFDEGKHGWDGFVCKMDFLNRPQSFKRQICSRCAADQFEIAVQVQSQGKRDFFEECASQDASFTMEDWVDAFEWIVIETTCTACRTFEVWREYETM